MASELTKIFIWNRDNLLWDIFSPLVGYNENFVYDQTTDSASVNIRVNSSAKPIYKVGDMVCIAHSTIGNTLDSLIIDSDGLPINHNQYRIGNIDKKKASDGAYWTVKMALVEPIEFAKGIRIDTLAFTNQTSKTVSESGIDVVYTKSRYTCKTALERVLKVTPFNNDNLSTINTNLDKYIGRSWYHRINVLDTNYLDSISFDDTTWSSADLFTDLFKFDTIVDKTPVLYFRLSQPNTWIIKSYSDLTYNKNHSSISFNVSSNSTYYRDLSSINVESDSEYCIIPNNLVNSSNYSYIHDGDYLYTINSTKTQLIAYRLEDVTNLSGVFMANYNRKIIIDFEKCTNPVPYNFTRDEYILKFERKDGKDKPILQLSDIIEKNTLYAESEKFDNYATGVASEVDNLTSEISVKFPAEGLYMAPEYDSDDRDTPTGEGEKGKWFLQLPCGIKKINLIKRKELETDYNRTTVDHQGYYKVRRSTSIINSKAIMEDQVYKASEYADGGVNFGQGYHYTEGDNKLYIDSYYSNTTDGITAIYYIEFEPTLNVIIQVGSGDYITDYNQSDSNISSYKFSQALQSYKDAMNKADIVFAKEHDNYDEIYPIGSLVVDVDEEYIITNVSYVNCNFKMLATYQLNKNNLRRNINVQAPSIIRADKGISYSSTKDRRVLFTDTTKLHLTTNWSKERSSLVNPAIILSGLIPNIISGSEYPQICLMNGKSYIKRMPIGGALSLYEKSYATPIIRFIGNNQIQFNIQLKDNAEIAKLKEAPAKTSGYSTFPTPDIQSQIPIIYTDPFGETQTITLYLSNFTINDIADCNINQMQKPDEYQENIDFYQNVLTLPNDYGGFFNKLITNKVFKLESANLYKDMLEKTNISIVFNVIGEEGITVCKKLLELSRLNKQVDTHSLKIYGFSSKKSENDLLSENQLWNTSITSATNNASNYYIRLEFAPQSTINLESVIITDNSNNKLLILNKLDDIMSTINYGTINIGY